MPLPLPTHEPNPLAAGLYSTDVFHRQPLFVVKPVVAEHVEPARVVRSWNEAHALHGPARINDVNPAYVAALVSGNHTAQVAPYRRIHRLPRAHHVLIDADGTVHSSAYDPLAGGAESMEAETLHRFLRQGFLDHLQQALQGHEGPVGCEHSSGLDSNAVLGALIHGVGMAPERLHTWSQEGGGEGALLKQFRLFHGLLPQQCHRFSPVDFRLQQGDDSLSWQLEVFGAPAQIAGNHRAVRLLRKQGCTLLFSGFGGDQGLSHNAANVPTDLVAQRRWAELVQWMGGRRRAVKTGASRGIALTFRSWAQQKVIQRTREFSSSNILVDNLSAEGRRWIAAHLGKLYPWEVDGYLPQHQSIRQRLLADWVAVRAEEETRLAAAHGVAKAFPLLNESLIATLLHQDPALFGESAGRGRLIHRRAFAPFLPPSLRDNPTKDRDPEAGWEQWHADLMRQHLDGLQRSLVASLDWHPSLARYWDLTAIRQETERILDKTDPTLKSVIGTHSALATMSQLSSWWQALEG